MARGKSKTFDEQVQILDEQINKVEDKLKSLKGERSELLKKKNEDDLKKLYDAIQLSGMSIDEVFDSIKN